MKIAGKKSKEQIKQEKRMREQIKANIEQRLKKLDPAQRSIKKVFELEEDVMSTLHKLNAQLIELNELNAIHNRGAVDIKDYCYHHLYSQEKFDADYNRIREEERKKFIEKYPEFAKDDIEQ